MTSARSDATAYDAYLASMDASMRQKVAVMAAHLLCEGRLADMGMGSGATSHALAALYPDLDVIGVDLDPEMVERASERFELDNLSFVTGDVAERVFDDGYLGAIVNSSVLHHVTSFGGYDNTAAQRALAAQAEQLSVGGLLIVRDFLDPGPGEVLLDLPAEDGDVIALLERFSHEFRALHPSPGAPVREVEAPDGWRRFRLSHTHAAEFILRKDYRASWADEIREAYTFATVHALRRGLERLGLRLLVAKPIWNPWIEKHRYEGKFRLFEPGGTRIDPPATNGILVAQKARAGAGITLVETEPAPEMGYLTLTHWERDDGTVYDLVRRPNTTLDVVPYFIRDGLLHVVTRRSYPRPIVGTHPGTLDGVVPASWLTEPLIALRTDKPIGQTVEEALMQSVGISAKAIRSMRFGEPFYPSPGGIQESVRAVWVELDAGVDLPEGSVRSSATQRFRTLGDVRSIEARQLLRAGAVGALPDARLEVHVAELLASLDRAPGVWIGARIELQPATSVVTTPLDVLAQRPRRRRFHRVSSGAGFLDVRAANFEERDQEGTATARIALERVVPRTRSLNTVALALLAWSDGRPAIGVFDDDLPAAQCFEGCSNLLTAPAWRLPSDITGRLDARRWIRERLQQELGIRVDRLLDFGGAWHPSAGVTAEVVHGWVTTVSEVAPSCPLVWLDLQALLGRLDRLRDGHLRTLVHRVARALETS